MLVEKNGRTFSVRTAEELDEALKKELASLTPDEREALNIVLQELRDKKKAAGKPGKLKEAPVNPGLIDALEMSEYKSPPVDVRTFIKDPYFLGNTCDALYPRYLDDLIELFEGGYNEAILCLHPDTPVPLLDGTTKTLQQLAADWERNPKPFWVYGVDASGEVVPAQAEFPRQTGVDDYYRVTLDDGTSFTGNARHQMVLRDGTKRMIRDMRPGDSIMPFVTRESSRKEGRRIDGYEMVLSLDTEAFRYTHALVEEDSGGTVDSKVFTIHHKNFNKLDNTPENLERLPWKEHSDLHHKHRMEYLQANPEVLAALKARASRNAKDPESALRKAQREFMKSAKGRKVARRNLAKAAIPIEEFRSRARKGSLSRWSQEGQRVAASARMSLANLNGNSAKALKARWSDPSQREAARQRIIARNKPGKARRTDVTARAVQTVVASGSITVAAAAEALACSRTRVLRALRDEGIDHKTVFTRRRNHYVVGIEKVGHGPVYCMTVPRTTNFAICTLRPDGSYSRQGVFSSNTGAIGIGKSFFCSIGICRILYEISCLKDPHKTFGLAKDTNITLACFSGDTEFYDGITGQRYRMVDAAAQGEAHGVVGFSGRTLNPAKSKGARKTGVKEVFEVRTTTGRVVKATADHQFLSLHNGATELGKLRVGDAVALAAYLPEPTLPTETLTDPEIRLLGYLISEGNTMTKHVAFGNTDERVINEFVADAKTIGCFDVTVTRNQPKNRKVYCTVRERAGKQGQRNVKYALWDLATRFGLAGKNSQNKRIPSEVFKLPNKKLALFLNRLFAGDGSCYFAERAADAPATHKWRTYQMRYATTSPLLARDVADALLRFGIFASIRVHAANSKRPNAVYHVDFSRKEYVHRFISKIGIFGREYQYNQATWRGFSITPGDLCWDEIVSITSCGTEDVYCVVDVEPEPWFVAQQFVVHNCFSVNEELATKVVFENIKTKIMASPYFQENFSFEATKKELRFPHNVWVAPRATTDTSALGLNVISAFMDEGNFLPKTGKHAAAGVVDHADVIYSSMKRRMKSRFERKGKLPGILFIASSKTTTDDFVSRRLRDAKNDPTMFVRDYALWDVKPEDYYSVQKFQVLVGNESAPSKILVPGEAGKLRPTLPEGTLIIDVPEDFRHDFERDLEGSIKDIAGCSVVSVSPFIQRREKLIDAVEMDARAYGPDRHPFSASEYDHSRGGQFIWEKIVRRTREQMLTNAYADTNRPVINPHAPRHIHIDIGLRHDALGFCMAHIAGYKDVIRRGEQGEYLERAPIYVVDLILRVVPPPGDEIILGDVRRLIYELSANGYTITSVSTDSFQSSDMIQQLNAKGFNARLVSVDTSLDPYENLKTSFYEDRVFVYDYPILLQELRQLQRDFRRRKVDHPMRGCFTGDTEILLADGSKARFDSLLGKQAVGIVTYDGKPLAAVGTNPRETMHTNELVEVELENGETIRCTPDHRFLLENGSYKEARHLTPEDDIQSWR